MLRSAQDVLEFWFGAPGDAFYNQPRAEWFQKNPAFDRCIWERFYDLYRKGAAGELGAWEEKPDDVLALILLFDQFPRNMFRGDPKAFATDEKALSLAQHMIARGEDASFPGVRRLFIYLPLEHSENIEDQNLSVVLFRKLNDAQGLAYALQHQAIIQQFGRFPHRNAVLGRLNTPEEEVFLKQPNSSF